MNVIENWLGDAMHLLGLCFNGDTPNNVLVMPRVHRVDTLHSADLSVRVTLQTANTPVASGMAQASSQDPRRLVSAITANKGLR